MNGNGISLTEAEWQVMEQLWRLEAATGREVTERMEQEIGWSRSTTLTMLRRLEAKGAVTSDSADGVKRFSPALRREDAALRETEDLLSRVYHGSVSLLVSSLTKKQTLSRAEIEGLYAILKEAEVTEDG
ncbi:MAG: BlaI/MecI/CopY family transcriptional regulator [Oscillospiraceae bacterium]|nr:BlaI/MecI/CopY family transcriptional regulator [Oscillospiraceae bacterium]